MASKKSAFVKKQNENNVKSSLNILFYFSKVFGLISYSLTEYYRTKEFRFSLIGTIWCLLNCINYAVQYHIFTMSYLSNDGNNGGTLTMVIGMFIIYLEPLMMIVDVLAFLFSQKILISTLNRLEKVDEKLAKENILLNYQKVRTQSIMFIGITIIGEFSLMLMQTIIFKTDSFSYKTFLWFFNGAPLFINGIARTWYLQLLLLVKQRLQAINNYFDETKTLFFERKLKMKAGGNIEIRENLIVENFGYLEQEIFTLKNHNFDKWDDLANKFNEDSKVSVRYSNKKFIDVHPYENQSQKPKGADFLINDKMDKKLIVLCRLHDEICEIAKQINKVFSFQLLITMAYGFMSITAQFYFLYCGLVSQEIPVLFRSASDIYVSTLMIIYTSYKCVVVIWISFVTRSEAQKTGIELHKVANVVDENHFYNICNHLSLKLLNHQLNFTACGFFDLDMSTIYSLTGAISSYLIIIIQFNLAATRTKSNAPTASTVKTTTVLPGLLTTGKVKVN